MNKERGNIWLIIVGIAAILFMIGFFNNEASFWDAVSYKKIQRLPCGLSITTPSYSSDEKVVFPIEVSGYINGCGWEMNNRSAGTAQVFDGKGLPVSKPIVLDIQDKSKDLPLFFTGSIPLLNAPQSDTGKILITSTTGLLYSIPISF